MELAASLRHAVSYKEKERETGAAGPTLAGAGDS
jgi:hypothetical protein